MKIDLSELEDLSLRKTPSSIEKLYFAFWERGISLEEFNRLPIPYIMSIMRTANYLNDNKR